MVKKPNQKTGHISEAILPTDFILGTKVQSNDLSADDLDLGQGQRSRSNFLKNG